MTYADEPDAFPFRGSDVLHGIARTACRGRTIYLTATPDEELKKRVRDKTIVSLQLNRRPHGKPLPVPLIRTAPGWLLFFFLLDWLSRHEKHPRMVFVPQIRTAYITAKLVGFFYPCLVCTSETENRDAVIEAFRKKKNGILLCTTVLVSQFGIQNPDTQKY